MEKLTTREFQGRLARIEELVSAIENTPDEEGRARSRELVEELLQMQGAALERTMELIYESGPEGQAMIDMLGRDELISSLLLLHGLHPIDLETRVRNAVEVVRPRLALHSGSVQVLAVTPEGAVKLRLEGNCHGCPSSRLTLKFTIEEAIYAAAPDVTSLEVEGAAEEHAIGGNGAAPVTPQFTNCPLPNGTETQGSNQLTT